ncbi:hypothetical protein LZ31DRAFT_614346 [Colletotrichum somersetense]|nr:hypothetical protein LZ31DRAFT_614346 [Colletotrichum somersetense]
MTAGQSCYFKVDDIPIRAAWIRRDFDRITKTLKYIAVLFVLVDAKAPEELEGTSLTWFNENPEMLIAWFTCAGFSRHLCKRIICYGRSHDFLSGNTTIREAHGEIHRGNLEIRSDTPELIYNLAEAICSGFIQFSEDKDEKIEDVLQDFVPGSKNLYVVGENLRSYGVRPMRLDSDAKIHGSFRV